MERQFLSFGLFITFLVRVKQRFHKTLQESIKSGQEISPDVLVGIPGYKKKMEKGMIFALEP